jgi:hypothetical protein
MTQRVQAYDFAVIRELLAAAFGPKDLCRFCTRSP